MKKTIGILSVIATSTLLVAGCGTSSNNSPTTSSSKGSSTSPASITVAYMPNMGGASSIAVAQQEGYFAKAGLNVHLVTFQTGPAEIDAMASGQMDVAYIGPGPIFMAMGGKAKVLLPDSLSMGDEVIVAGNSGIKTAADLKGKSALVPLGTTAQIILYETLHSAGLSMSDMQMINTNPTAQVAAFLSHQAPVMAGWEPATTQILQRSAGSRVLASDQTFYPKDSLPDVWLGSNQFVSNHPDVAKKFIWAILQAMNYKASHLQQAVQWTSAMTQVPVNLTQNDAKSAIWPSESQLLADYQNGTVEGWFDSLAKTYVAMGRLSSVPDFSSYSEPEWVQQASEMNFN